MNEIFVAGTCTSAIIDPACTKTLAGKYWFENYKSNLPDDFELQKESSPSDTAFKFGHGRKVKSIKIVATLLLLVRNVKSNSIALKEICHYYY